MTQSYTQQYWNHWTSNPTPIPHEFRIYADDRASVWATVDEEDYHWAIKWLWSPKPNSSGSKIYLFRHSHRENSVYLHKEICRRAHGDPPSEAHTIADHRNGNSLVCFRSNLRWATRSQNRLNINGCCPYDWLV